MLPAIVVALILVPLTIFLHYEALRLCGEKLLGELRIGWRWRLMGVVLGCFASHTVHVWLYAFAYWIFDNVLLLGSFTGLKDGTFIDYLYFSGVTYSTLGLGDIAPTGGARLIAGVEALNGLVLVGWSASFTYLMMEQCWPLHGSHGWRRFRQTVHPPGEAGEAD
jgi:hypothetical protein